MKNSQESNTEILSADLTRWLRDISAYPPLETQMLEQDGNVLVRKLSISVPAELKKLVTRRAKLLGLSRSQYILLLVNADIANQS